ncbi:MAG: hypothetical protein H0T76_27610 [Nannocystis sp.]|nr:hypothetical protein [Nannocystis sp.]MBA3550260.1 hypothetical protein [Nannocystis sp.]
MRRHRLFSRALLRGDSLAAGLAGALALAACSDRVVTDTTESGGSSGASSSTGSSTGGDPTTGPCTVDCPGDLPKLDCDLLAQDCPAGSKCSSNGDLSFCAPLDPSPGAPGEACTVTAKGVDSCAAGAFCWVDGLCHLLCSPDADPACPAGAACINADGFARICVASCEPVSQTCPEGQACVIPSSNVPVCAPDISGAGGEIGDVCQFINGCDPGNQCDQKNSVPDCAGASCCTPFCDLGLPEPGCPTGQKCLLFYPMGTAPAGLELLGTCGV